MDHDRLFKELLMNFFVEFIELFLPDVAAYLDPNSLVFLDKEVFTDVTSGERHEADIVVRAKFRGEQAFFLIHVENQASAQEAFPERMFRYFARLHEKHRLPIYPVVVFSYDTPLREEPDHYDVSFPGRTVLEFRYTVIQLNRLNWRDFLRHPNPVASALMAKMRIAPEDRPKVKLECLRMLATLRLNPARTHLISGFVDSYLSLNAEEQKVFKQEMQVLAPAEEETVMEIMTSWKLEGIEEGMKQGRREEALSFVRRLLARRIGNIEASLDDRVSALTVPLLEELGEALLGFESAIDLEAWLSQHTS